MPTFLRILMSTAFLVLIFVSESSAQIERRNDKVARLTPEDSVQRWSQFANSQIGADYCMNFTIAHTPRKAEETAYRGEIFGAKIGGKSMTRIRVWKADAPKTVADFIFCQTPAKVWRAEGGKFAEIPREDWSKPILDGLIYSPFDFLLPFREWNCKYIGAGRIGQAVHFFELTPPSDKSAQINKSATDAKNATDAKSASISKVRIALSREFNSPVQFETFDAQTKLSKTMSLGSVRKIDGLWIMLEAAMREESSRDKDKLRFTSAKMRPILDKSIFDPSAPVTKPPKPALERL